MAIKIPYGIIIDSNQYSTTELTWQDDLYNKLWNYLYSQTGIIPTLFSKITTDEQYGLSTDFSVYQWFYWERVIDYIILYKEYLSRVCSQDDIKQVECEFALNGCVRQIIACKFGNPQWLDEMLQIAGIPQNGVFNGIDYMVFDPFQLTISTTNIPVSGTYPLSIVYSPIAEAVYVGNYTGTSTPSTVSAIDVNPNSSTYQKEIAVVPVGAEPQNMCFSPSDYCVYTPNNFSNTVSIIDTNPNNVTYNTVVATVATGSFPQQCVYYNNKVFVCDNQSANVIVIDANPSSFTYHTAIATMVPGGGDGNLVGMTIDPDNGQLYISSINTSQVAVFDANANTFLTNISVGAGPRSIAYAQGLNKLYVINQGSNSLSVIDTGTNTVTATISTPNSGGGGIIFDPTTGYIWFGGFNSSLVYIINPTTDTIINIIQVDSGPSTMGINPTEGYLYVPCRNANTICVIDMTQQILVYTLIVGSSPVQVVYTPSDNKMYGTVSGDNSVASYNRSYNYMGSTCAPNPFIIY